MLRLTFEGFLLLEASLVPADAYPISSLPFSSQKIALSSLTIQSVTQVCCHLTFFHLRSSSQNHHCGIASTCADRMPSVALLVYICSQIPLLSLLYMAKSHNRTNDMAQKFQFHVFPKITKFSSSRGEKT